jgi:hypothetical protein
MNSNRLPKHIRNAASFGLRDPEDSGQPRDEEQAIRHFESGQLVRQLLDEVVAPINISDDARTAIGAEEHSALGDYPDDPTYIR